MTICQYCHAETDCLGTHYGRECPDVRAAFGPVKARVEADDAAARPCRVCGLPGVYGKDRCRTHHNAANRLQRQTRTNRALRARAVSA